MRPFASIRGCHFSFFIIRFYNDSFPYESNFFETYQQLNFSTDELQEIQYFPDFVVGDLLDSLGVNGDLLNIVDYCDLQRNQWSKGEYLGVTNGSPNVGHGDDDLDILSSGLSCRIDAPRLASEGV